MTDHDRGAYTPQTDAPLAFDARQPRSGGGGRSPTALIVSGVVLVLLIGAVAVFYKGGVRGANEPPRPVGAPVGELKTAAPPAARSPDDTASLDVYKSGQPAPAGETPGPPPAFAPAPEKPLPRPAPHPTLKVETADLPPVSGPPLAVGPVRPAPVTPLPVTPVKPAAAPAATAKPAAATLRPTAPAPAAGGGAVVQIGAFSSEALAGKGWSDVAAAFPADMAGKGKRTEAVQAGGATLHRGLITGFAARADAVAFCAKLKAGGRQCLVK